MLAEALGKGSLRGGGDFLGLTAVLASFRQFFCLALYRLKSWSGLVQVG